MPQRLFFFELNAPAPAPAGAPPLPKLEAWSRRARRGALHPAKNNDWTAWEAAARSALHAAGRVTCWVGSGDGEGGGTLPERFRGVRLRERDKRWFVEPEARAEALRALLADLPPKGAGEMGALRRLEAAVRLARNEPWDGLFLRLDWSATAPEEAALLDAQLVDFAESLWLDVAVVGLERSASGEARWCGRLRGGGNAPLPEGGIGGVWPTLLNLMGVEGASALPGTPLDLETPPPESSGYSAEDERAIQKRLEDLGYL